VKGSTVVFDRRTPAVEVMPRRRAWKEGEGLFKVIGRTGTRYHVRVKGSQTSCSCTAGTFGRACWHQLRVLQRIVREGMA
jgi:hypothetical protein